MKILQRPQENVPSGAPVALQAANILQLNQLRSSRPRATQQWQLDLASINSTVVAIRPNSRWSLPTHQVSGFPECARDGKGLRNRIRAQFIRNLSDIGETLISQCRRMTYHPDTGIICGGQRLKPFLLDGSKGDLADDVSHIATLRIRAACTTIRRSSSRSHLTWITLVNLGVRAMSRFW